MNYTYRYRYKKPKNCLILSLRAKIEVIDRACLAEKSARKDEKTLFWPPPTSLFWLPNQRETKQR